MSGRVFVAMSGGVDSSVAALLLKRQGYQVIGITMQIWPQQEDNSRACCSLDAVNDARRVAWKLDIPHYVFNFRSQFQEQVIEDFYNEYRQGRTPNPCIACNRYIKFESFLNRVIAMGGSAMATGHYARIIWHEDEQEWGLYRASDHNKDQTYALFRMNQYQLARTLLPNGDLSKPEIRELAREANLPVADKEESQDICFVPTGQHYAGFIESYRPFTIQPGRFKTRSGEDLGPHQGIHRYTVGQRRGLGLQAGRPLYVIDIDEKENTVWVGTEAELYQQVLWAEDIHLISDRACPPSFKVEAKIRYNAAPVQATARILENEQLMITFDQPQKAVTPGQSVVLYQGDRVMGGGVITRPNFAKPGESFGLGEAYNCHS